VTTATGEVVREGTPRVRRRAVSARVARTVAELLVAVTEGEGTGTAAAIPGYRVAGKTATAQKTDPRSGRYSVDDYIASFVGFVPADKPVVAIAVMVDSPRIDHAGGNVAAPIFRRVGDAALTYFGLTPHGTEVAEVSSLAQAPDPAQATYEVLRRAAGDRPPVQEVATGGTVRAGEVRLPDMTGWPEREAVRRATELGVRPEVVGTGLLSRQTPTPGTVVPKGEKLTLVFEPAT
jgi:cell division protein FtsI (penicillin-binding protein 3)